MCDAPGALSSPCFLVVFGPPEFLGIFFSWWEWKDFIDLFLCSARITVLADALSIDPLGSIEQPKHVRKEFFRGSEFVRSTWKQIISNVVCGRKKEHTT